MRGVLQLRQAAPRRRHADRAGRPDMTTCRHHRHPGARDVRALRLCPEPARVLRTAGSSALLETARGTNREGGQAVHRCLAVPAGVVADDGNRDPLDHRLVESYWLGGGIGCRTGPASIHRRTAGGHRPQAGHYWTHLTEDLADEAHPNHCFHVFAVYPWSRLLGTGQRTNIRCLSSTAAEYPGAQCCPRDDVTAVVLSRSLCWDGSALSLSPPHTRRVDDAHRSG